MKEQGMTGKDALTEARAQWPALICYTVFMFETGGCRVVQTDFYHHNREVIFFEINPIPTYPLRSCLGGNLILSECKP